MIRGVSLLVGLLVGLAWSAPGTALGAGGPASPPYPSREVIRSYLSDLSDAEVGALVRGRVDEAPSTDRGRDLASAASALDEFRSRFNDLVTAARSLRTCPRSWPRSSKRGTRDGLSGRSACSSSWPLSDAASSCWASGPSGT